MNQETKDKILYEAQERFYDIHRKVTEHHNTALKKNRGN